MAHVVRADKVPSTGANDPFCHLFFEFGDGSYIAFFDIKDGRGAKVTEDMPSWLHHFAMEVNTVDEILTIKQHLEGAGVEVVGVTDHGFIQSIYFFDPNGLRLEVTTRVKPKDFMDAAKQKARGQLDEWIKQKRASASA
ncbi:Glyoxalase/Bleomycin resistance protein/Dioxygenase superfamily protein [compost metagenome]